MPKSKSAKYRRQSAVWGQLKAVFVFSAVFLYIIVRMHIVELAAGAFDFYRRRYEITEHGAAPSAAILIVFLCRSMPIGLFRACGRRPCAQSKGKNLVTAPIRHRDRKLYHEDGLPYIVCSWSAERCYGTTTPIGAKMATTMAGGHAAMSHMCRTRPLCTDNRADVQLPLIPRNS